MEKNTILMVFTSEDGGFSWAMLVYRRVRVFFVACIYIILIYPFWTQTNRNNEGFKTPKIWGLQPMKRKVVGSHGTIIYFYLYSLCLTRSNTCSQQPFWKIDLPL